jgi:ADP-ribosyl-[dinitrogen reductase] hydrolase
LGSDRSEGTLLGLACGDALGRPVEFNSPGSIQREHGTLTEMVGGGTWNKPAGTVTDDTDQMLCIARSLDENGIFDPQDVAERFVGWYESGPFDIGNMTRDALGRLRGNEESWQEVGKAVYEDLRTQPNAGAGNGSVMRCAPVAVAYSDDLDSLFYASVASSWITHADPRCTYGCALLNRVIAGLLHDEKEGHVVDSAIDFCREKADDEPGTDELFEAIQDVRELDTSVLSNSGYVVDTVQSSLYYSLNADTFEDAVVDAVNAGGDTDTVGAVTGAVAGARFGASDIPERWTDEIGETTDIQELAQGLSEQSFDGFDAELSYSGR